MTQQSVYTWLQNTARLLQTRREVILVAALSLLAPATAMAQSILMSPLCRTYRSIVSNELFAIVALVAAIILVIGWKLGLAKGILGQAVGLLCGLVCLVAMESLLARVAGVATICAA